MEGRKLMPSEMLLAPQSAIRLLLCTEELSIHHAPSILSFNSYICLWGRDFIIICLWIKKATKVLSGRTRFGSLVWTTLNTRAQSLCCTAERHNPGIKAQRKCHDDHPGAQECQWLSDLRAFLWDGLFWCPLVAANLVCLRNQWTES